MSRGFAFLQSETYNKKQISTPEINPQTGFQHKNILCKANSSPVKPFQMGAQIQIHSFNAVNQKGAYF